MLNLLSLIERVEDPIGERLIGERPKPGTLLEFGRMRWQKEQMQSFGKLLLSAFCVSLPDLQTGAGACLVQLGSTAYRVLGLEN